MSTKPQFQTAPHDVYSRPNETMGLAPKIKGDKLTALVKKLYAVLLLVSQEQGDREEYAMPLGLLIQRGNIDSKNTKLIRTHLESMRRFSVTWNTRKGEEIEWRNTGLLKEVWITQGQGRAAMLYWELSKKIRERLIDPESFFTRLSLQMMTSLRSGSSITLYEICCQYASNDRNGEGGLTRRAEFEWWRPRLSGSLDDDNPQEYKYFKRDMLIPAIKEINEITDIEVELIEHRVGRRIGEIQFRVHKKNKPAIPLLATVPTDFNLVERLERFGLTRVAAERLCRTEEAGLVARTAEFVEKRMATGKVLASAAAYFAKALREKWALANLQANGGPRRQPVPVSISTERGREEGGETKVQGTSELPRQSGEPRSEPALPATPAPAEVDVLVEELARIPAWQANYEQYLQAPESTRKDLLEMYKTTPKNPFAQEVRKNGLFKKLARVDFGQWLEGRI